PSPAHVSLTARAWRQEYAATTKGIGMTKRLGWLAAAAAALMFAGASYGQHIAPLPPAIPAPQDIAYPAGPITIDVDATNTVQGIFRVHEVAPVSGAGPITLLYPRWLPGNHGPSGPVNQFAGL